MGSATAAVQPPVPPPIYQEDDPATQVFVCPLCCDLAVKDPSVTHCQHIFCRECITAALNRRAVCPIDRGSLRLDQVSPIAGPLKQVWRSVKVNCPKCKGWSGPLETYESHVKSCSQLDEEQIKKLRGELASSHRVNTMLTKDLATVQGKLNKTLKANKQLEKELANAKADVTAAKAAHEMAVQRLREQLTQVTMLTNNARSTPATPTAAASSSSTFPVVASISPSTPVLAPAAATSSSTFSPILAAAYSTMANLAVTATPVCETAAIADVLPGVTVMRTNEPVVSIPSFTTTTTTSTTTSACNTTTAFSLGAGPSPTLRPRRSFRAKRPVPAPSSWL